MKRRDFIRHLEKNGCYFMREGGNHSIYSRPNIRRSIGVPRHPEIDNVTARAICKELGIPIPKKK